MSDSEKGNLKLQVDVSKLFWQQRTSEPVVIHQLPWIIRVNPEWDDEGAGVSDDGNGGKHYHLGCRVVCVGYWIMIFDFRANGFGALSPFKF